MNCFRVLIFTTAFLTGLPVAVFAQQLSSPSAAQVRFLTVDPSAMDYWPCLSPDSNIVLFSRSTDGGKTWALFVVPTSGGEAHRFAELPVSATRANWSSHNNQIAFTGTSSDGTSTVWLINADGTQPRQITAAGLSDRVFYPSWYPDGKSLAVMDAPDNVIKRIDLRGRAAVTVTNRDQILAGMPSVSPDGKSIAFAGQKNTGQKYDQGRNSIWLVSDTGELRSLETNPVQGRTPAWSADGQWLAFESNRASPNQLYAVFIINRNGSGVTQITPYELNANHPVWSHDQKHLVFSARHANGTQATGIAIMGVAQ